MPKEAKRKPAAHLEPEPPTHRTVDRVTRILEEVVYNPGIAFAELARALDAPPSSVHGFIRGLLAKGWLYEEQRGFYLGPAVYGLTLVSGHIRAGLVTNADLVALHEKTGIPVFLGVAAGDQLIYVAEAGGDALSVVGARSNIRRTLLATAGGKALLAARQDADLQAYLRRRSADEAEAVDAFLSEYEDIRRTRVAIRQSGTRSALGTVVRNQRGEVAASVTLVGPTREMQPRMKKLQQQLLQHVDAWSQRSVTPREAI